MRMMLIYAAMLASTSVQAADKPIIANEGDLPPTRFAMAKPSEAFLSDDFLKVTVPALRAEAEKLRANYRIEDDLIARKLALGLAAIDYLQGRYADAKQLLAARRAVEPKPQLRIVGGMPFEAIIAGDVGGCAAAGARETAMLRGADPLIVRDEVVRQYGQAQEVSNSFIASILTTDFDDPAANRKSIDVLDGLFMAQLRVLATGLPKCRAETIGALRAWIDNPANRPVDIWPGREPPSGTFTGARPVVVAVWDTGVDASLFAGRLAIDPAEPLDGRDNDGNGIVDDVYGPSWDNRARPTAQMLGVPSAFLAPRLALTQALAKGKLDLYYGMDTPETRLFVTRAREASGQEQADDALGIREEGDRDHGTFVASEISDGAPFVRIYPLRLVTGGYEPKVISVAEPDNDRFDRAIAVAIKRMRGAGVRVVNMSWAITVDGVADDLIESGAETDPDKARLRAIAMYNNNRVALEAAIRSAPDILFVAGAGNNSQTAGTFAAVPQSIVAPNIIVVGALGQSGQPTMFTTFGKGVDIYARGEGTLGRIPGGMPANWSGTSMAAPNVARAAAYMLAVNPKLTAAQIVEGLKATATAGNGGLGVLHPGRAVEWARTH